MDWKTIIAELQEFGLTQPQIAEKCAPCGQATISDLASGNTKEPRYGLGVRLKRLHQAEKARAARKSSAH